MSFAALAKHEREIGHVVAVTGTKVVLELYPEEKSPVHSYPGGLSVVAQIGAYLLFPVGAGDSCVGVLTGAYEHEGYEPTDKQGMTLQLAKPRRTLHANLLGTLTGEMQFEHGVTVYPSLGTVALIPSQEQLRAILSEPATARNQYDVYLELGNSPIYETVQVSASLDDLFSRPLAIVGNTGSGKSWTVATLVQVCRRTLARVGEYKSKFIVLDINGEYSNAFGYPKPPHHPNFVYLEGKPFFLPLWVFGFEEFVRFFGASTATQTQVPVLERIVTMARQKAFDLELANQGNTSVHDVRESLLKLERAERILSSLRQYADETNGKYLGEKATRAFRDLRSIMASLPCVAKAEWEQQPSDLRERVNQAFEDLAKSPLGSYTRNGPYERLLESDRDSILRLHDLLDPILEVVHVNVAANPAAVSVTADAPFPFDISAFGKPELFDQVLSGMRGEEQIREYVATLQLRMRRMLQDRRWSVFTEPASDDLGALLNRLLWPKSNTGDIVIVDCSMLAYDVLPFFCAVIGRLLLETRQHGGPQQRTVSPWVLVLEEAHNYLRPYRENEDAGLSLSRNTFERVAKEGRKFGLSLAIASQRPSDVSQTVLAQCANFIVHRIQNPDDIEYFRRILPAGFREVLDQVGVLVPGEALLMGSAVNVPSRVRIRPPNPPPFSETPRPSVAWKQASPDFDIAKAIENWRGETSGEPGSVEEEPPSRAVAE